MLICSITIGREQVIHPKGYWLMEERCDDHQDDHRLSSSISEFFINNNCRSIVDMGCGTGYYVRYLKHFFTCDGVDGNPHTEKLTDGAGSVLDLTEPVVFDPVYDWVLSLEVGEHIPVIYEDVYIENLHNNNTKGIILSWALPGQGGFGHLNERENSYIKDRFKELGYTNEVDEENKLREAAYLWWFKDTIMVFRR